MSAERVQIQADLRKGLERGELELYYQPFYSLDEERIVGAEALVRWRHPANGLISPAKFIPMAEETGLILPLGRHVLDTACRRVRRSPHPPLRLLDGPAGPALTGNASLRPVPGPGGRENGS